MLENFASTSPRPDSRHATATYNGSRVEVTARQDVVREGSHVIVVVRDTTRGRSRDRRVEYVIDYADLDDAIGMGIEVAQALVDGRLH